MPLQRREHSAVGSAVGLFVDLAVAPEAAPDAGKEPGPRHRRWDRMCSSAAARRAGVLRDALALGPLALKVLSLLRPVHMPAECVTVRSSRLIKLT